MLNKIIINKIKVETKFSPLWLLIIIQALASKKNFVLAFFFILELLDTVLHLSVTLQQRTASNVVYTII